VSSEQNPDLVRVREQRERERRQSQAEYREAVAPVLQALAEAGFPVPEVMALSRTYSDYRPAIPVLLHWLTLTSHPRVKESIVRALSVHWSKSLAVAPRIDEFGQAKGACYKWAVGNALEVLAGDDVFRELVELACDHQHGKAREMVVMGLGKMKNPEVVDALIGLLRDEQVAGHALCALRKLKPVQARPYIEPFVQHPRSWWRNEAKQALVAIDRARARREGRAAPPEVSHIESSVDTGSTA
jgi:HEAT repeat protein